MVVMVADCNHQYDIVIVLDLSGSVADYNSYILMVNLTRSIINGFDIDNKLVRIGVLTYDTNPNDQFYLNKYSTREEIIQAISFNHNGGSTGTQKALARVQSTYFTNTNGDRSGIANVVILVSDGMSDIPEGSSPSANAASKLKSTGATIITISLGDIADQNEMITISSDSDHVFSLDSSTDYITVASDVDTFLC